MTNSNTTLYFAYGSNLSLTQMSLRCPTSTYHSLALLPNYKWVIGPRGYANIVSSPSPSEDVVYGMLYNLSSIDEASLDIAEGVPTAYTKHYLTVTILPTATPSSSQTQISNLSSQQTRTETETETEALIYIDTIRTGTGTIKSEYITRLNRGINDALALGLGDTEGGKRYLEDVLRKWVRGPRKGDVLIDGVEGDPFHPSKMI